MKKNEFTSEFKNQHGFICVDDAVVEEFYEDSYNDYVSAEYSDEEILALCADYIVSQDLAEEVVE